MRIGSQKHKRHECKNLNELYSNSIVFTILTKGLTTTSQTTTRESS